MACKETQNWIAIRIKISSHLY